MLLTEEEVKKLIVDGTFTYNNNIAYKVVEKAEQGSFFSLIITDGTNKYSIPVVVDGDETFAYVEETTCIK